MSPLTFSPPGWYNASACGVILGWAAATLFSAVGIHPPRELQDEEFAGSGSGLGLAYLGCEKEPSVRRSSSIIIAFNFFFLPSQVK